jgi:hypothetical protein
MRRAISLLSNPVRKWLSDLHTIPESGIEAKRQEPDLPPEPYDPVSVLAVLPDERDRQTLQRIAVSRRWQLLSAKNLGEAVELLRRRQSAIVLVDRDFLGIDWRHSVRTLLVASPASCIIPVLEAPADCFWEELIQQGGYDVLAAPLSEAAATRTIQFAWAYWKKCVWPVYGY